MTLRVVGAVVMCGVFAGCSSWVPTVVNNGVNHGINVGRTLSADRSIFNVLDDFSIKNTITNALLDEALILNVSTDVYQGMVMLTGAVKDEETRQKAEDLARKVDGVRELYNDIQVTDEGWLASLPGDLMIESAVAASMVFTPGVHWVNYQLRAANGVVHVMGIAKSRAELDQVVAIARASGARKIVSHVFLTEAIVLDGAPETMAGANAEPALVRTANEPAKAGAPMTEMKAKPERADPPPDEMKAKTGAKGTKKKSARR
jgi:osmotically-inducible protein OsmY